MFVFRIERLNTVSSTGRGSSPRPLSAVGGALEGRTDSLSFDSLYVDGFKIRATAINARVAVTISYNTEPMVT